MRDESLKLHLDSHNQLRALEEEARQHPETAHVMDDMNVIWDMQRKKAAEDHSRAAMVMHEYQVTRRPFALYLRSFETEAYDYLTPENPGEQRWQMTTLLAPSRLEEGLATALEGRLAVIAIANPSDLLMRGRFPRLQLPNEGWQAVLENLVEHAHLIVMDCEELAPGVEFELDAIRKADRTASAIIVLPPPGEESKAAITGVFSEIRPYVITPRDRPHKEHVVLAGFPRLAYENEIEFDRLETSTLFGDLLASAAEKSATAPPFDSLTYSKALNNEGVEQFRSKNYGEALRLYAEALLIRRATGDRSGQVTTLLNIGCVYIDAGQPVQAMPYLTECRTVARDLGLAKDEGLAASYMGFSYELCGDAAQAVSFFEAARPLQREISDPEDFASTLTHLAKLYASGGKSPEAVECYRELVALRQQRADAKGEVRALLELGGLLFEMERKGEAANAFVDAANASRKAEDPLREAIAFGMLGKICVAFGQTSKAVECCRKGLAAARAAGDEAMIQLLSEQLAALPQEAGA